MDLLQSGYVVQGTSYKFKLKRNNNTPIQLNPNQMRAKQLTMIPLTATQISENFQPEPLIMF